jgi:hypothetical protein
MLSLVLYNFDQVSGQYTRHDLQTHPDHEFFDVEMDGITTGARGFQFHVDVAMGTVILRLNGGAWILSYV